MAEIVIPKDEGQSGILRTRWWFSLHLSISIQPEILLSNGSKTQSGERKHPFLPGHWVGDKHQGAGYSLQLLAPKKQPKPGKIKPMAWFYLHQPLGKFLKIKMACFCLLQMIKNPGFLSASILTAFPFSFYYFYLCLLELLIHCFVGEKNLLRSYF